MPLATTTTTTTAKAKATTAQPSGMKRSHTTRQTATKAPQAKSAAKASSQKAPKATASKASQPMVRDTKPKKKKGPPSIFPRENRETQPEIMLPSHLCRGKYRDTAHAKAKREVEAQMKAEREQKKKQREEQKEGKSEKEGHHRGHYCKYTIHEKRFVIFSVELLMKNKSARTQQEAIAIIKSQQPIIFHHLCQGHLSSFRKDVKVADWEQQSLLNSVLSKSKDELENHPLGKRLLLLSARGLCLSVAVATDLLELEAEQLGIKPLSRHTVYELMKKHNLKKAVPAHLPACVRDATDATAELEKSIKFLMTMYGIPKNLIYNIDETSKRLMPLISRRWLLPREKLAELEEMLKAENVVDFPFPRIAAYAKRHTTMTAAVRADGTLLKLQVLFKGIRSCPYSTDHVACFLNGDSSWANKFSLASLMFAIESDRQKTDITTPAIVIMDCAPVHVSIDTRRALAALFPMLLTVFVPPNFTYHCQPLDVSFFGPFKKHFDSLYTRELLQKHQHNLAGLDLSLPSVRDKFVIALHSTAEHFVNHNGAIADGWKHLRLDEPLTSTEVAQVDQRLRDDAKLPVEKRRFFRLGCLGIANADIKPSEKQKERQEKYLSLLPPQQRKKVQENEAWREKEIAAARARLAKIVKFKPHQAAAQDDDDAPVHDEFSPPRSPLLLPDQVEDIRVQEVLDSFPRAFAKANDDDAPPIAESQEAVPLPPSGRVVENPQLALGDYDDVEFKFHDDPMEDLEAVGSRLIDDEDSGTDDGYYEEQDAG